MWWGGAEWSVTIKGMDFFNGDKTVLELTKRDGTQPCEYARNQWSTYFKVIQFMVCELYLHFKKPTTIIIQNAIQELYIEGHKWETKYSK